MKRWPQMAWILGLGLCWACGRAGTAGGSDAAPGRDASIGFAGIDAIASSEDGAGGDESAGGGHEDLPQPLDGGSTAVATVAISAPASLELGGTAALEVTARGIGGEPIEVLEASFTADGEAMAAGPEIPADLTRQKPIALWPGGDGSGWWIAGVRPGSIEVVARVGGVASEPLELEVLVPSSAVLRLSTPGAGVTVTGGRVPDDSNTVRLFGEAKQAGGGRLTVRFPVGATEGSVFDLDAPPSKGGLSVQAALADLAGAKVVLAAGRIYLDQTTAGEFIGAFVGQDSALHPVVGAFRVPRTGRFGVDLLDKNAQLVAKSDSDQPQTGQHHSRLSLMALGPRALVVHRHIENKLQAEYTTELIEPVQGKLELLPPLLGQIATYSTFIGGQPGPYVPALGYAAMTGEGNKRLLVWEGRAAKGYTQPQGLWARLYDDKLQPLTAPVLVADEPCDGGCRPRAVTLPGRYAIFWNGTGGGIRSRLIDRQLAGGKLLPGGSSSTLLIDKGSDVSLAEISAEVVLAWRTGGAAYTARWDPAKNALAGGGPTEIAQNAGRPAAVAFALEAGSKGLVARGAMACAGGQLRQALSFPASPGDKVTVMAAGPCAGDLLAAGGRPGQLLLVEVVPGDVGYQIRARKLDYTGASKATVGKAPGPLVQLGVVPTGGVIVGALTRIPEANAFVVGWSGDFDSPGVWLRRLR